MTASNSTFFKALLMLGLAVGVTACETLSPTGQERQTAASTQIQTSESSDNKLSPRVLEAGACGLFVWIGPERIFKLFSQNGETAVFQKAGKEVTLTPTSPPLELDTFGQATKIEFKDETDGQTYSLELLNGQSQYGGLQYSSGRWRYEDQDGWTVVQPASGFSTCLDVGTGEVAPRLFEPIKPEKLG